MLCLSHHKATHKKSTVTAHPFVLPDSLDNQLEGCDLSWVLYKRYNFLFFLHLMTVLQWPPVQEQRIL